MMMTQFLMGASTAGFVVASIFFLRFWTRTRDQLFAAFAAAFLLLAIERTLLFLNSGDEPRSSIYVLRLIAFCLIGIAILRKNREK